ncbi:MAG TPA: ABC transporter substrate-binding protein, partial [Bacillota bacterium]
LFAPVPVPQATIIADAARQAGLTATLLGGVDWSRAEPADGLTGAVSVADFHPERDDEATRAFVEAYREAYGSIPSAAAALAYDGLQRLLLAVEGTVASGRFDAGDVGATRTALQALLRQAGEYQGVTGRWWMEAPDRARKTVPIVRLDVGEPPAATYLGDF